MPQLTITPAVSPQSNAVVSQSQSSAAEGGDGLQDSSVLNFGAIFTKQLKGIASLLEQKEDAGLSLVAFKEDVEPAVNAEAVALPVDLSVLTASMLVSTSPAHVGMLPSRSADGVEIPAEAGVEAGAGADNLLIQFPKASEVRLAAEIAVNGKSLPQAVSPEQQFADKLVALAKAPAENAVGEFHSVDPSASANHSASAAVFRGLEPLLALPVAPRVGSAEWGGAVGERVVWMANQSHQVAELHLNPPNLGPIEVRLTISNDQASALFVSHHSAVREAIETALPRLREMLADNGIMLGNVTVGSESFSQQQASDQRNGNRGNRGGQEAESVMARMAVPGRSAGLMRDGMVDIFA